MHFSGSWVIVEHAEQNKHSHLQNCLLVEAAWAWTQHPVVVLKLDVGVVYAVVVGRGVVDVRGWGGVVGGRGGQGGEGLSMAVRLPAPHVVVGQGVGGGGVEGVVVGREGGGGGGGEVGREG